MKRLISKDPVYDTLVAFREDHPDITIELHYLSLEMSIEFVMRLLDDPKRTARDRIPYSRIVGLTDDGVSEFICRCLADTYKLLQEEKKGDIYEQQRDAHDQEPQKQKDVQTGQ